MGPKKRRRDLILVMGVSYLDPSCTVQTSKGKSASVRSPGNSHDGQTDAPVARSSVADVLRQRLGVNRLVSFVLVP